MGTKIKIDFDNELNQAGWTFIELYQEISKESCKAILFNNVKTILKAVIEEYLTVKLCSTKEDD